METQMPIDVDPEDAEASLRQEVHEEIIRLQRQPFLPKDANPLVCWKENETQHVHLSPVARAVLAMPAPSAPSERAFSAAGLALRSNRGRLDPEIVEDVVFLRGFYKFMERNPAIMRA